MPVATSHCVALQGAIGHMIDVQVDVSPGVVVTSLVGRPDASINEAKDRIRTAITNSGFEWPATRRVTILLSPADLPKCGPHFDRQEERSVGQECVSTFNSRGSTDKLKNKK